MTSENNSAVEVLQTPTFAKQKKKFRKISELNNAIKSVIQNPTIGAKKKRDLSNIRVYKFKAEKQEILLAYQRVGKKKLILTALGVHENFYRNIKKFPTAVK